MKVAEVGWVFSCNCVACLAHIQKLFDQSVMVDSKASLTGNRNLCDSTKRQQCGCQSKKEDPLLHFSTR